MASSTGSSAVSAWERVKLARHAERPHTLAYLNTLTTDWIELHGDRSFGDDLALIGGLASFDGQTVMVLGHQKATTPGRTSLATSAWRGERGTAKRNG